MDRGLRGTPAPEMLDHQGPPEEGFVHLAGTKIASRTEMYSAAAHEEEDIDLSILAQRLQLLTLQRKQAAKHCEKFVRFLEEASEGGNSRGSPRKPANAKGERGPEASSRGPRSGSFLVKSQTTAPRHRRQVSCPDVGQELQPQHQQQKIQGLRWDLRQGAQSRRQTSFQDQPVRIAEELLSFLDRGGDIVGPTTGMLDTTVMASVSPPGNERPSQENLLTKLPKSSSMSKHRRHRRSSSTGSYKDLGLSQLADVANCKGGKQPSIALGKSSSPDPFADVALDWEVTATKERSNGEKGRDSAHRRQRTFVDAGELTRTCGGESGSPPLWEGAEEASPLSHSVHVSPGGRLSTSSQPGAASPGWQRRNRSGSLGRLTPQSDCNLTWQGSENLQPRQHIKRPTVSPRTSSLPPLSPAPSWITPPPLTATSEGLSTSSSRALLPPRPLVLETDESPSRSPHLAPMSPSPDSASMSNPHTVPSPPNKHYAIERTPRASLPQAGLGVASQLQQEYRQQYCPPDWQRPSTLLIDCQVSPERQAAWHTQSRSPGIVGSSPVNMIQPALQQETQFCPLQPGVGQQRRLPRNLPPTLGAPAQFGPQNLPRVATSPSLACPSTPVDVLTWQRRPGLPPLQTGGFVDAQMGPLSPSSESSEVMTSPSTPPMPRSTSTPTWGVDKDKQAVGRRQRMSPSPSPPPISHSLSQPSDQFTGLQQDQSVGSGESYGMYYSNLRNPRLSSQARTPHDSNLFPVRIGADSSWASASRAYGGWQVNPGSSNLGSFSSTGQDSLESFPSGSSFVPSPHSREMTPPKLAGLGKKLAQD